ncbi:hypothetical protein METBIDRAFT_206066 [Metschnikowia bicuspidata var. bicuspidata NRRL YB-4993]|uniref:Secreted protein n=1 Tax=Metschnikowia bicuspidata var. bicuspidata NRRL YB-4993 TaxID=869754 RepID=A0A1A0H9Y2_9ASCO|nr:hypothetical protein METBIDRAFT_206066 [Metschnikowia bicuspidata var. bicuspidata NRRL YB-4993]OBA20810.1 hypothetical protein METBIDRAFT_206066 [Metschnikowia bicuspidata var. bicuspidata NRRL YB-4993]
MFWVCFGRVSVLVLFVFLLLFCLLGCCCARARVLGELERRAPGAAIDCDAAQTTLGKKYTNRRQNAHSGLRNAASSDVRFGENKQEEQGTPSVWPLEPREIGPAQIGAAAPPRATNAAQCRGQC